MKSLHYHIICSLIVLTFLFTGFSATSQTISNVDFYLEGENLIITYDLLKTKGGEKYKVWIDARTGSGPVNAKALSGDVGEGVKGGTEKEIVWNITADNFYGAEDLQIEVFAIPMDESEAKPAKAAVYKSNISTGKALLYSLILPGLGNNYVKGGGAYWLIGVAGYGALAGSYILNQQAIESMNDYRTAETMEDRDSFFEDAESQDQLSTILAGTAIAIWVGDLIWTGLQAGAVKKRNEQKLSFSVDYQYMHTAYHPSVKLTYRF